MDHLRDLADLSIRRGCGFAAIGIVSVMTGLAGDAVLAAKGGALLVTLTAVVLLYKGLKAPARNYRRTELWIMLDRKLHGVPESRAQHLIGRILRERYMWHAQASAAVAFTLWLVAFAFALVGTSA
jgi:hypothetical protein